MKQENVSKVTIKFHSEARKEFFELADFYEYQVVGLGDDFINEVEKVLDVIEQQPASGTKITKYLQELLIVNGLSTFF